MSLATMELFQVLTWPSHGEAGDVPVLHSEVRKVLEAVDLYWHQLHGHYRKQPHAMDMSC